MFGHRRFFVHVGNTRTHPRDQTKRRLQQRKEKKQKIIQRRIRPPTQAEPAGLGWRSSKAASHGVSRPPFPVPLVLPLCREGLLVAACLPSKGWGGGMGC